MTPPGSTSATIFKVRLGEYLTEADLLGDGFACGARSDNDESELGASGFAGDDGLTEHALEKGTMFLGGSHGASSVD